MTRCRWSEIKDKGLEVAKAMESIKILQQMQGLIVSDKMDKTVVVRVDIRKRHPKYHKAYTVSKRFKAHNPENTYKTGDIVVIEQTRPMSKEKKFIVIKKI